MRRRTTPVGVIAGALLLALTACGGGSTGDTPKVAAAASGSVSTADEQALGGADAVKAMQDLYQAAKSAGETTVTVYGPGETDKAALYKIFSQRFPDITVNGVYLVGPDYAAKMQGEHASGQHVADLVQAGDTSIAPEIGQHYFADFDPVTAAQLDTAYQDPTGTVRAASASTFGFVYNTNLMKPEDAPKGWQDLLDPKYKGKMTSEDATKNGGAFGTLSHMLWDGRYDASYMKSLAGQSISFQSSGAVAGTSVATGQYALDPFYPLSFYMRDKAQGAPVGFVFPTEGGAHLSPHYLGLVDGAPHPNAAKLLETWLFSPEGQKAAATVGYYPLMPGVAGPAGYPAATDLDKLKPFPIAQVAGISNSNLATVKAAFAG
jgi:iron(III) transport system substrate-binding protein